MTDGDLLYAVTSLVDDAFPVASAHARAALVDEHVGALTRADARRHWISRTERGAVGLMVEGSIAARGWIMGITLRDAVLRGDARRVLGDLERLAHELGEAPKLRIAGPPGSYLLSGIAVDDGTANAFYTDAGYTQERAHIDLAAKLLAPQPLDPRVRRARRDERPAISAWIADHFAPAWSLEAAHALEAHDALFVASDGANYLGFAAHSGNNAALGTFGPIGVLESARRGRLGGALARSALDDLAVRGFATATIPWVDPALARFYAPLVEEFRVIERRMLVRSV